MSLPMRAVFVTLAALFLAHAAQGAPNIRLTNDAGASHRPRVALDPDQNAIVVWQDDRFGNNEILWQKFDQYGNPLTAVVRVTNTVASSVRPDVFCDANGTSHVVWQEGENVNGVGTVYMCRLTGAGVKTFGDLLVKDFSGDAKVTCPSAGVTDLFFARYNATDQDVYYRRYNTLGSQACERRFNAGTIPAIAKTPAVCSATSGDAQLFWIDMNTSFQVHLRQGAATNSCASGAALAYNHSGARTPSTDRGGGFIYTLFEVNGDIYNFQGAPNACKLSQGSGTSTRPSVSADGSQGYAVWRDSRDGNSEIYFCRFLGCPSSTGDVRLTNDPAVSEDPDLVVEETGSGRWVAVWSDGRDGNREIYLASAASSNTPISLRVSVQAKADHDNDPLLPSPPTLEGVSVTLDIGASSWQATTDVTGVASFPTAPYSPGGTFTLRLEGPRYNVSLEGQNGSLAVPTRTTPMQYGQTQYLWPYSRSTQAAYQLERFRKQYWLDRFGYEWQLPQRMTPSLESNPIEVHVYERLDADLQKAGGASAITTSISCMTNKCEESDILFHEFTHSVIFDRFDATGPGPRRIGFKQDDYQEGPAMDEGLADYFTASYTNDPQIDRCQGCIVGVDNPCICGGAKRDISKRLKYPKGSPYRYKAHTGGRILSGALWELRKRLDGSGAAQAPITDHLAFAAIDEMIEGWQGNETYSFADYYTALRAVDQSEGGLHLTDIDAAFESRNIGPLAVDYIPLAWVDDAGVTGLDDTLPDRVTLAWAPLPGAVSYDVLMIPTSFTFTPGIGEGYVQVATGLTDTAFTYLERDPRTEYLFTVVAVDTAAQPGYLASPVYVPATDVVGITPGPKAEPGGKWLFASPNPFRGETAFAFELARDEPVGVRIFDPAGRLVRTWAVREMTAGRQRVTWDGRGDGGSSLAPGVYFVEIRAEGWRVLGRTLLLR